MVLQYYKRLSSPTRRLLLYFSIASLVVAAVTSGCSTASTSSKKASESRRDQSGFKHPGEGATTRSARKPAPPDAQQRLERISYDLLPKDSFVLIRPAGNVFYVHAETQLRGLSPEELKKTARQLARDYIFAIYGTALPIGHASILIQDSDGGVGLTVGVAEREAGLQPLDTWSDKTITPDAFLEWVSANSNEFENAVENRTWVHGNWGVSQSQPPKLPQNHPSLGGPAAPQGGTPR